MSANESSGPGPSKPSVWNLPCLNKNTFYTAALYLHAAKGQFKTGLPGRVPEAPEKTREFLDHLADCFARSKSEDARDHVSATAMVRNEEQKKITLYIAKNQSEKGCDPPESPEALKVIANHNEAFAKELVKWLNLLMGENMPQANVQELGDHIWQTMCKFSQSRLEHYIGKIKECEIDDLGSSVPDDLKPGWQCTKDIVDICKLYEGARSSPIDSSS